MPHVPCGSQGFVPRNTGHDDGCVQGVGCKVKIQLIYLDLFKLNRRTFTQEFNRHGMQLQGPAQALANAGTKGKHPGNVARDIYRRLGKIVSRLPC